jgi:hypothetical protein
MSWEKISNFCHGAFPQDTAASIRDLDRMFDRWSFVQAKNRYGERAA